MGFVLAFTAVFLFTIVKLIKAKDQQDKSIAKIPLFSFTDLNGESFTNKQINTNNKQFIINYFSPNCEHCQSMARLYVSDSHKLRNVQILMITSSKKQLVQKFIFDYQIKLLPNVKVVLDTNFQFQQIFKKVLTPSYFIYEKDQLVKQITGEVKIDLLLQ